MAGRGGKFQEPPKSERLPPQTLRSNVCFRRCAERAGALRDGARERTTARSPGAGNRIFRLFGWGKIQERALNGAQAQHLRSFGCGAIPRRCPPPPSSILAMCARGTQCGQVAQTQRAKGSWNAPIGAVSHALMNHAVLEPAIFGSEDQRLIHLATEPSSSRLHHIQECL